MQWISCRGLGCRTTSPWAYQWLPTWQSCGTQRLVHRMWTLLGHLIGSLMYLMHTRPDICYIVNALSQFMSDLKQIHLVASEHVLKYVRGTITYELKYTSSSGVLLSGYSDSDWVGSVVDRKSTSGYCFSMGSTMISWSSRKQGSIAQSTAEAKYIVASDACKEVCSETLIFMYGLFTRYSIHFHIHCIDGSAICFRFSQHNLGNS